MLTRRWIAAAAAAALASAGGVAAANPLDISCAAINQDNIAAGLATENGYSIGAGISGTTGALSINNQTLALPPNGILCVQSIACASSSRTLTFAKNAQNTPVFLYVEGNVSLAQASCGIDVSGGGPTSVVGLGYNQLGGAGGPGGSDGGSCDSAAAPVRTGAGHGPGGGRSSATAAGGGGASPITNGANGFSGAVGGTSYSQWTDRLLHGGSGGGCGGSAGVFNGGAGGGGAIVIAAGGSIQLTNSSAFVQARGGASTQWGGGGGGGVVRLVAATISGSGAIRVDGSAGATCGNSTTRGGCGGAGLVRLEGDATGGILTNVSPATALFFGEPQEVAPPPLATPTLQVQTIEAVWNGVPGAQTPVLPNPQFHVHRSPSVFVEAPSSPQQVVLVRLLSNNVASTATVVVKMNAIGTAPVVVQASTAGTGSGELQWEANLTIPANMQLGTVEAWVENTCAPGVPGCNP